MKIRGYKFSVTSTLSKMAVLKWILLLRRAKEALACVVNDKMPLKLWH